MFDGTGCDAIRESLCYMEVGASETKRLIYVKHQQVLASVIMLVQSQTGGDHENE